MTIIYEDDRKVWICDHCGHRMTQLSKDNKKLKLTTVNLTTDSPAKRCSCCGDDLLNPRSTMYKDRYFDKEYRKHIGGGFIPSLVEEESK